MPAAAAAIFAVAAQARWIVAEAPAAGQPAPLPRFELEAYNGGPMPQIWSEFEIVVDLAGLEIPRQDVPVMLNHNPASGIGHTTQVRVEAGRALLATGVVSRATPAAAEAVSAARNGYPWQASIQADVLARELLASGQTAQVNGRELRGPLLIARRTRLREISFVDLGADATTHATVAAAAAARAKPPESSMDLKTRKEALLAKHPQHAGLILAALVDGLDDPAIASQIDAAERAAVADQLASARSELASVKASLAERDQQIAALTDEVATLKANRPATPPAPAGAGGDDGAPPAPAAQHRSQMDRAVKAAFIRKHGRDAFLALPA